jgi:hypothetical protein
MSRLAGLHHCANQLCCRVRAAQCGEIAKQLLGLPFGVDTAMKNLGAQPTSQSLRGVPMAMSTRSLDAVMDKALRLTVEAILHLLELVDDWAMEMIDPEVVYGLRRGRV